MICTEGRNAPGRIAVTSNVYDIPARLKELNRDFFVMLNTCAGRYEIHNAALRWNTLECVLPYDALDARAVAYARENMSREIADVAREIEAYNERLVRRNQERLVDKANYKMRETLNYLKNNSKTDAIPQEVIDE